MVEKEKIQYNTTRKIYLFLFSFILSIISFNCSTLLWLQFVSSSVLIAPAPQPFRSKYLSSFPWSPSPSYVIPSIPPRLSCLFAINPDIEFLAQVAPSIRIAKIHISLTRWLSIHTSLKPALGKAFRVCQKYCQISCVQLCLNCRWGGSKHLVRYLLHPGLHSRWWVYHQN